MKEHNPRRLARRIPAEHPEFPPIPGFECPEDQIPPDEKAKKLLRDADKAIEDAARELKKQIKKATGKP